MPHLRETFPRALADGQHVVLPHEHVHLASEQLDLGELDRVHDREEAVSVLLHLRPLMTVQRVLHREGAADGASGAVEGREDPVTGCLDYLSSEMFDPIPYDHVVHVEHVTPSPVPERRGTILNYFVPRLGTAAQSDLLEGIDTSWSRYKGGEAVAKILQQASDTFDSKNPAVPASVKVKYFRRTLWAMNITPRLMRSSAMP